MLRRYCLAAGILCGALNCASKPPKTPKQCYERLQQALSRGPAAVYELIDEQSRWDVMSIHRAHRTAYQLIADNYPPARQRRALARVALAARSERPASFFAALVKAGRLSLPKNPLGSLQGSSVSGDKASLSTAVGTITCCKQRQTWAYCDLRRPLEPLKLRAARELKSVEQNVAVFKGRTGQ